MRVSTKSILMAAALTGVATSAFAQGAAPTPWELKSDMGYAYGKDGKTLSYKMGTNNAGTLLKGADENSIKWWHQCINASFLFGAGGMLRPSSSCRIALSNCPSSIFPGTTAGRSDSPPLRIPSRESSRSLPLSLGAAVLWHW